MSLKALLIYWPLLSIAIVAVLCRLVHNAKVAVRALEIQLPERQPLARKTGDVANRQGESDTHRRAA